MIFHKNTDKTLLSSIQNFSCLFECVYISFVFQKLFGLINKLFILNYILLHKAFQNYTSFIFK